MGTVRKPVIDHTRVAEGFLFDTHRLRCQYLGKTTSEKPRWLEEHNGQYQRVEDILKESARLEPPDNIGAAPTELNCHTSSPIVGKRATTGRHPPEWLLASVPTGICGTRERKCSERVDENELPPSAEAVTRSQRI